MTFCVFLEDNKTETETVNNILRTTDLHCIILFCLHPVSQRPESRVFLGVQALTFPAAFSLRCALRNIPVSL